MVVQTIESIGTLWMGGIAAVMCTMIVALAEWLQAQRNRRVARLAFGRSGQPSVWARSVPLVRVFVMSIMSWGFVILLMVPPQAAEVEPAIEASKHVLVCLDSSPSMFLKDAGRKDLQSSDYEQRMVRAGKVVQAVLDRLDAENTRITVFGVYTKAVPIVEETYDKSVVQNLFDGLPVYSAFKPGPTQLSSSVAEAIEYARRWPDDSTLLLIVSDGDSTDKTPIRAIPKAISDTLVIGVGQSGQSTSIAGHPSRQDADSLRTIAEQLRGSYYDANLNHLPSELLNRLAIIQPRVAQDVGLRDAAVLAIVLGSLLLSILLPALSLWGMPRKARVVVDSSVRNDTGPSVRGETSVRGGLA